MTKLDIEPTGMFKLMGDAAATIWFALFGPRVEAGQTWYTSYRDHIPTQIFHVKGFWIGYGWPDGRTRWKLVWDFRLCYCRREDFE